LHDGITPAKKTKRGGRKAGAQTFITTDKERAFEAIWEVLPYGANKWEKVAAIYNKSARENKRKERDGPYLKKFYTDLCTKGDSKPTGDPHLPWDIQEARRIRQEIAGLLNMGSLGDDDEEEEEEDDDEEKQERGALEEDEEEEDVEEDKEDEDEGEDEDFEWEKSDDEALKSKGTTGAASLPASLPASLTDAPIPVLTPTVPCPPSTPRTPSPSRSQQQPAKTPAATKIPVASKVPVAASATTTKASQSRPSMTVQRVPRKVDPAGGVLDRLMTAFEKNEEQLGDPAASFWQQALEKSEASKAKLEESKERLEARCDRLMDDNERLVREVSQHKATIAHLQARVEVLSARVGEPMSWTQGGHSNAESSAGNAVGWIQGGQVGGQLQEEGEARGSQSAGFQVPPFQETFGSLLE
jgi:hypothetical protein